MKYFIFGKGQLGTILEKTLLEKGHQVHVFKGRLETDTHIFTSPLSHNFFSNYHDYEAFASAEVIVNTIAIADTRLCEKNWTYSNDINCIFPFLLANHLENESIKHVLVAPPSPKFIHISSACIFNNNTGKPFAEHDAPTPLINYALQKYQAEGFAYVYRNHAIVRPRMLFSDIDSPFNLIKKVSQFKEVIDEQNSMTCAYDLANFIEAIGAKDLKGTFNFCNKGTLSPADIGKMIDDVFDEGYELNQKIITKDELYEKTKIKLTNTLIDSSKAEQHYDIPDVKKRMEKMIESAFNKDWLKQN